MRYPWANILLLLFILSDMLSGFFGLISGSEDRAIYIQVHRVSGYGILAVLAWKVANIARSFKWPKKKPVRIASLALAVVLIVTLGLGLVWSIFGDFSWWMFSGVSWHIYAGVVLAPLLLWHGWYMFRGPPIILLGRAPVSPQTRRPGRSRVSRMAAFRRHSSGGVTSRLCKALHRVLRSRQFLRQRLPGRLLAQRPPPTHQPRHLVAKNLRRSRK